MIALNPASSDRTALKSSVRASILGGLPVPKIKDPEPKIKNPGLKIKDLGVKLNGPEP